MEAIILISFVGICLAYWQGYRQGKRKGETDIWHEGFNAAVKAIQEADELSENLNWD